MTYCAESDKMKVMEKRIQDVETSLHDLRMSTLEHKMEQTQRRLEGVENTMKNISVHNSTQEVSDPFLDRGVGTKDPPWVEKENNKSMKNGRNVKNQKRKERGQRGNADKQGRNWRGQQVKASLVQNHSPMESATTAKSQPWQQAAVPNPYNVMGLMCRHNLKQ